MQREMYDGRFYLGRLVDPQSGKPDPNQPLLYDPNDLTTHAVVVGMTGSGKTGLCIGLLEEAALHGVPALMIDPKGDITNSLLHFPDLAPQDFLPWVNADQARREHKSVEQMAVETAGAWRRGLAEWGIAPERLQALKNAAHFAVYTPGSDAGIPVSILASLKVPSIPWEGNRELLREKIAGTATALLGLVGVVELDPLRSREHILLSNIFEHAWSQGKDLDLKELITQTQNPPFSHLGVFDVNTFFPERDRFGLAMLLNNILAAPAFQSWTEGQALDIPALLYGADGRPRHSVFYLAHLSDAERMFFVTLLYSAVETWMRSQTGSTGLRALLYFDEIFGYLPPVNNPPSKQIMLRMLKQARAFGVGQVLVTQNPVDLDYKALSNAGTWFIGKLQTEQDKQRLLDGLDSAVPGGVERGVFDRLISALGKRTFLLHNVHDRQPLLFQSRWAMNYLAGPLTRIQIPALNRLSGAALPAGSLNPETAAAAVPQPPPALDHFQPVTLAPAVPAVTRAAPASGAPAVQSGPEALPGSSSKPAVPGAVNEYYLPNNLTLTGAFKAAGRFYSPEAFSQGLVYRPVLLAQAHIRYYNARYGLDYVQYKTALVTAPDRRGVVRWEDYGVATVDPAQLDRSAVPQARFAQLEAPLGDSRAMAAMEKDFAEWAYRSAQVMVRAQETLKLYAGPDVSQAEFRQRCADAARQARDTELRKVVGGLDKKINALELKLGRQTSELEENENELSQRRMEEWGTHAENLASLFSKRSRRLTTSLTRRRLTDQARSDLKQTKEQIEDLDQQLRMMIEERNRLAAEINERWAKTAADFRELSVAPFKKDVLIDLFGLAWYPYHLVRIGAESIELSGYTLQGV